MKLLGFEIGRPSQSLAAVEMPAIEKQSLNPIYSLNTFWGYVRESFSGAWQTNTVVSRNETLSYFAVYACISLIAQDISKMRPKLIARSGTVWEESSSPAFSPVLRKPNHYQTRIKFIESWVTSKLVHGNTYILKERDSRGVVVKMYVLDPQRVVPLVSDSGDVYYELKADFLAGLQESTVTVPASEIIHDTAVTLYHPLCGVSPLYACGLAAAQGLKIQQNSKNLFSNGGRPSGMLVAPAAISDETATQLKAQWEANYSGDNYGKTAVLGDGLKYEPLTITPENAQMIEQLKMTAETICSTFHVPPFMIGIGQLPQYDNVEPLNQQYYSQALQANVESLELLLDEGLALPDNYGIELDLDALLRMDTARRYKSYTDAIGGGWFAPNEARRRENMRPIPGGDTAYMQQQNYSLAALAKRDAKDDPFASAKPAPQPSSQQNGEPPEPPEPPPPKSIEAADIESLIRLELEKVPVSLAAG